MARTNVSGLFLSQPCYVELAEVGVPLYTPTYSCPCCGYTSKKKPLLLLPGDNQYWPISWIKGLLLRAHAMGQHSTCNFVIAPSSDPSLMQAQGIRT